MRLVQTIAGSTVAGCASTIVGHPLDTLKVHLQTNLKLHNTFHATQWLLRHHSPFVLFRGMAPPLLNAVLMNSVMFLVFDSVKESLTQETAGPFLAGAISGFATATLSTPTDYVKIQSQLWGMSSAAVLKTTLRKNPRILFRGHLANLGREGIFTMVYLGLYDRLKGTLSDGHQVRFSQVAALSSFTGALAWVTSFPFDTLKSVVQGSEKHISLQKAARDLWALDGYYRKSSTGYNDTIGFVRVDN